MGGYKSALKWPFPQYQGQFFKYTQKAKTSNWDLETYKFCDEAFFRVDNLCRRNFDLVAWKSTTAKKIVLFLIKIFHLGDCKVRRQNGLNTIVELNFF